MKLIGSFDIESTKLLGKHREKIKRSIRDALYRHFTYAVGEMLMEIGKQIPYLTGETREVIQKLLNDVELKAKQYGGKRSFSIPMRTTLRKTARGVYPQYSSNLYSVRYARTYRKGWGKIESRGDWRDYLEATNPRSGTGKAQFSAIGTATTGKMFFIFSMIVEHWERYDTGSVPGHPPKGPWHVLDDGLRVFHEVFASRIEGIMSDVAMPLFSSNESELNRALMTLGED